MGQEAHLEDRERLGNHPGEQGVVVKSLSMVHEGPGGVGRPNLRSRRHKQRSGRGRMALTVGRVVSEGPPKGPGGSGGPTGDLGEVGRQTQRSRKVGRSSSWAGRCWEALPRGWEGSVGPSGDPG